ncbi:DegT/DnrJ/EryC1/StrS family aminotransferase [Novosphingobium sp. RD2P27]|uniref:DegT/DnrJ/EryC1/StrS family aminotransferase n=1 Tax=Novosphingobium kalidii TaxID=3230299 RepID=A0ABV2D518_9SPHN
MSSRIFYSKPSITELEQSYAADAAANGWGARCYDYIVRFEKAFGEWLGSQHTIATSSCTGALHMGLAALGVGPGDEIILADTNWVATVAPIRHLGATPVFVDVSPDSWCIDPAEAQRHVTARTRAIIATHVYGNLCDMDALLDLSERTGVPIVEDAAEAIGSEWRGRRAGSMGLFGTFSFHGTKTLTTGEGGMFVTSNDALYRTVQTLSNHGRAVGQIKQFWPEMLGFKYKMSNLQAAIGCGQLERADELVMRKRAILAEYRERLAGLDGVSMNPEPLGTINGAWMPTAVCDPALGVSRELLLTAFEAANIDARPFFHPLSSLPMFEDKRANVNAWDIPKRAINLPSYHEMEDADIDRVADTLIRVVRGAQGKMRAT